MAVDRGDMRSAWSTCEALPGGLRSPGCLSPAVRPAVCAGPCGSPAGTCRNRRTSTFPQLSASYIAPCPRRCSAVNVRSTGVVTGPSAHSNASVSSNSMSPRAVRQSKESSRQCDATANASRRTPSCSRLIPPRPSSWSSASLVGAQDQTKAVFASPESSYEGSRSVRSSRAGTKLKLRTERSVRPRATEAVPCPCPPRRSGAPTVAATGPGARCVAATVAPGRPRSASCMFARGARWKS